MSFIPTLKLLPVMFRDKPDLYKPVHLFIVPFQLMGIFVDVFSVAINSIVIHPLNFIVGCLNAVIGAVKAASLFTLAVVTSEAFLFALIGAAVVAGAIYLAMPYIRPAMTSAYESIQNYLFNTEASSSQRPALSPQPAAKVAPSIGDSEERTAVVAGAEVVPAPVSPGRRM